MDQEWIEWQGGECPTEWGEQVQVRYADGTEATLEDGSHASWAWYDTKTPSRIVAYRPASPTPAT